MPGSAHGHFADEAGFVAEWRALLAFVVAGAPGLGPAVGAASREPPGYAEVGVAGVAEAGLADAAASTMLLGHHELELSRQVSHYVTVDDSGGHSCASSHARRDLP